MGGTETSGDWLKILSHDRSTETELAQIITGRDAQEIALMRCASRIAWYRRHGNQAKLLYFFAQSATILLGALTSVLILYSQYTPVSPVLQALPAAFAAIFAGLSSTFHWQQDWLRYIRSAEDLLSELVRFKTTTSEKYRGGSDQGALENFVARVETICANENLDWLHRSHTGVTSSGETGPSDSASSSTTPR